MKLGFIVDSSVGFTQEELNEKEKNIHVLPLFISINDKDYADGVDINVEKIHDIVKPEDNLRTSATPPGMFENLMTKLSKKYDHVLVYPLSEGFSSQVNNFTMISKDLKNIHVIRSKVIGSPILHDIKLIKDFAKDKKNIDEIVDYANSEASKWYGFVVPYNLDRLVKGGRVRPAVAQMAKLLKIIPIVKLENGILDKEGKGRVFEKAVNKMFKKVDGLKASEHIYGITSSDDELAKITHEMGEKYNVIFQLNPSAVAFHTGIKAIGGIVKIK